MDPEQLLPLPGACISHSGPSESQAWLPWQALCNESNIVHISADITSASAVA